MSAIKKLLVPVDFSAESANALRYAATLAKELQAEVIALHVIDPKRDDNYLLSFTVPLESWPFLEVKNSVRPLDLLMRDRALELWHFVDQTVRASGAPVIRRIVRLGSVGGEIGAVAREENINFLVLKLRKRRLFPGVVASKQFKMLARLPYPVLLAPTLGRKTPVRGQPVLAFHLIPSENPV